MFNIKEANSFANQIRIEALKMVHRARASHIGGALSMADILSVLYAEGGVLRNSPRDLDASNRDRLFLSKGHACTSLYAALALSGYITIEELETYGKEGSRLMSHASHKVPGVELSTGSLGHALPVASGLALGFKRLGQDAHNYVILSDGEMDEGSNWEAILFSAHHKLDNLTIIIDFNGLQGLDSVNSVTVLDPLMDKLKAFNWDVTEVDGHDIEALYSIMDNKPLGKPMAIIANTVKGKGVPFMEKQMAWHYRSPKDEDLRIALDSLSENGAFHA